MRVDDALLDKIADEFLAVKGIVTHQHSAVITFEQFLVMRLKKMGVSWLKMTVIKLKKGLKEVIMMSR